MAVWYTQENWASLAVPTGMASIGTIYIDDDANSDGVEVVSTYLHSNNAMVDQSRLRH